MIAASGPCSHFKLDLLKGLHNFLSHEFRMALYTSGANLHANSTAAYTAEGEAVGIGYVAGGQTLRNVRLLGPVARAVFVSWDDVVWPDSTLVARGALIYNQTAGGRAVAVLNFQRDRASSVGEFRVHFPPASPSTALIRLL
jgi:hypothetical protein